MTDGIGLLASALLLVAGVVGCPRGARCPDGWYAEGVRPSGVYACRRAPTGDPDADGTYGHLDRTIDHPGWYVGRIYCTGGTHPILAPDGRAVGCQR